MRQAIISKPFALSKSAFDGKVDLWVRTRSMTGGGRISVEEAFYKLEKGDNSERELFRMMNQAMDNIEQNAFCGIQMPKRLIPKEYMDKGIKNLWKYDLPRGWRLMYSIVNEEVIIVSVILEWFDHKEYERRFNY